MAFIDLDDPITTSTVSFGLNDPTFGLNDPILASMASFGLNDPIMASIGLNDPISASTASVKWIRPSRSFNEITLS